MNMKKIIYIIFAFAAALTLASSCSKVLEEQPRTFYEPGFFKTESGVKGGLTALYSSLRNYYGQAYYYNINTTGTDEATYAQSADGNFKDADLSGVGTLNSSTSRSDALWGVYTFINTASGIIENAEAVNLSASLIAEARFFRAFYYFQLVQTFGGVPLDLGSGELKFNSTAVRTSVRNTVPEVYKKAIFADLVSAIADLPDSPRVTGGVTKNVARLVLAKAYLTFGWWLENPKNIPTYPLCDRKDLDGHDATWYYQQSLALCQYAIANPGPYGLCTTFREVNLGKNDRNKEILLWADHTQESELYNGGSLTYGSGGAPDNFAGWMMNWNHGTLNIGGVGLVIREARQEVGRPWTRMAPTHEAIKTFTSQDVSKDSRFDGTFTTKYYGTWNKSGNTATKVTGANGMDIKLGECVLSFVPTVLDNIKYPDKQSNADGANVGAGTVPGRADYVFDLNGISRIAFPALWKLGPYRTDYNIDTETGSPNAGSTRPFNILKFSDFYLTGAEAAVKANENKIARDLINVLRHRAGVWTYNNNNRAAYTADFGNELESATPATITINYVLDERMREFYGEGFRWFDLVRTQTWAERAGTYTISNPAWGAHSPSVYTRTIPDYLYLRPIPQGQLDGMEMTDDEKAAYQNPGYTTK
jgi:hypothetical protein